MDEIQEFMRDCYDSSRWYHDRSDEQRRFDGIVMAEIAEGRKIGTALKKAARQVPEMATFVVTKSIPEFKDYYSRLRRMEQELAVANNMRMAAAMRKRKAQQG